MCIKIFKTSLALSVILVLTVVSYYFQGQSLVEDKKPSSAGYRRSRSMPAVAEIPKFPRSSHLYELEKYARKEAEKAVKVRVYTE